MDRRLSISSARGGYCPFFEFPASEAEITGNQLVGPFTRPEIIALIWRVKKLRVVASVAVTSERQIYNEATEEYEMEATSYTRALDEVISVNYLNSSDPAAPTGDIPDEDFLVSTEEERARVFRYATEDGSSTVKRANLGFPYADFPLFGGGYYDQSVGKDSTGALWLNIVLDAYVVMAGDAGSTVWEIKGAASDGDGIYEFDFAGSLDILGNSLVLGMKVTPESESAGSNIAITSAAFAVTVEEWRPYATSSGDPAWNTTTGAPANGGPGA
jgi:hypothetical protein